VLDEREAVRFCSFLEPLQPHEARLLLLVVRGRVMREKHGVKVGDTVVAREIIRPPREGSEVDVFLRKARRLCVLMGHSRELFVVRKRGPGGPVEIPVPPDVMGVLVLPNPRHVPRAVAGLVKEIADRLYEVSVSEEPSAALAELGKTHVRFAAQLHKHASRRIYFCFDVDVKDESIVEDVLAMLGGVPALVLETPRGYHVLVKALGKEERARLYRDVLPEVQRKWRDVVEFKNEPQEPLPGAPYAGFRVRIVEAVGWEEEAGVRVREQTA